MFSVQFQRAEQSLVDGREMDAGVTEESKIEQINLCNKLLNFDSFVISKRFISCYYNGSMGMFLAGSLLQLSFSGSAETQIPSKQTMSLRAPWSPPVCPLFGERTRKKDSCRSSRLMYQAQKWCMSVLTTFDGLELSHKAKPDIRNIAKCGPAVCPGIRGNMFIHYQLNSCHGLPLQSLNTFHSSSHV